MTIFTRLVLANAIYFKGNWLSPFNTENTKALPFHLTATKTVNAPMMHQMGLKCGLHINAEAQLLELPYVGEQISMVVLLPQKADGLAAETGLCTPGHLREVFAEDLALARNGVLREIAIQ